MNPASRLRTIASTLAAALLAAGAAGAQGFHASQRVDLPTGLAPSALVVADLDGDGRPDVATGNYGSSSISVFLSKPGRTFAPRRDYPLTLGPTSLIAVDLNGDGFFDLVVAGWPASALTVLLNDGAGHFSVGAPITVAAEPTGIAAGDWNEDGKLDLAIAHDTPDQVGFLYGDGAGSFGGEALRSCGSGPLAIRAADLNGDGHVDLAFTNSRSASVGVLLGAGNGGFTDAGPFPVGSAPSDLAIGDFDGDGIPDLVVDNFASGTLSLLKGLWSGAFAPRVDRDGGGISVTAVDVSADGHLDLLVGQSSGTALALLCNDGAGNFPTLARIPTDEAPIAVAAGDLDGDGNVDLVSADRNADGITVTFGYRPGEFQTKREFATGPAPVAIALGDVDGDGNLDVATANWLGNSVSVLRGDGTGALGPPSNVHVGLPLSVQIADVNGDGHPDLVTTGALDQSIDVFTGDGAGHFTGPIVSPGGQGPSSLALADLDGDSHPDVVFTCSDHVQSSLGAGDGSFAPADTHTTSGLGQLALGQLDSDSHLDAAEVIESTGELHIFHGFGTGSFAAPQTVVLSAAPTGIAIANFAADGRPGLAISVSGAWGPPPAVDGLDVFFLGPAVAIAAGDVNGDGRPDVACANTDSGRVSVFYAARGSFGDRIDLDTGPNTRAVALADLNQDGLVDVIATEFSSPTTNRVVVFLGKQTSRTTLAVSPATLHPGGALTLDADVTTPLGPGASGTVTFFDRGTPLVTAPLVGGHAHAVMPAPVRLPTGTIVAVYGGSAAMRTSASDPAVVRVLPVGVTAVSPSAAAGLQILGPNPIQGRHLSLTLAGGPAAPGRIEVFDPSGRRVAAATVAAGSGAGSVSLDLAADRPPGIYFVRARRGSAEALRRLVVLR